MAPKFLVSWRQIFVTFRPLPWYMTSCFEEEKKPQKKNHQKKKPTKKKNPRKKPTPSTNQVGTRNFRNVQAFALIHDQLLWRKKPTRKKTIRKKNQKKNPRKTPTPSTNKVGTQNFCTVQAFALIHDQLLWRKKPTRKKNHQKKTHQKKTHEFWRKKTTPRTNKVGTKSFRIVQAFALIHDQLLLLPGWLIWFSLKNKYHVLQVENWFLELFKNTI